MTIKPLVELLDVKRKKRALPTVSEEIHSRVRNQQHVQLGARPAICSLKIKIQSTYCMCIIIVPYTDL